MIPRDHGQGSGLGGLLDYVLHDSGHARTSERVELVEGLNLPPVEGDRTRTWARAMRQTVADADSLKASIGASTKGRKLRKAYKHVTLSWDRGENPSQDEMVRTATEALEVMGFQAHEVILVAHNDKAQRDMHAIINRVHPRTGKVAKGVRATKLQKWAEKHERQHGGIRVANRRKRRIIRELNALRENNAKKRGKPAPTPLPLPPIEKKRARDPDGTARVRSAAHTQHWKQLYAEHRASDVPKATKKRDRIELNQILHQQPEGAPAVPAPPPVVVVVPVQPGAPLPRVQSVSTPAEQVPPPADVPVWPRVEFPVVQSTLTPVVPAPPPAVEAVPVQPGAPLPRVQSVSTPAEQVPPPADVPVWPRVEFPVVQSTLTPVVPAPPPAVEAVPVQPGAPLPRVQSVSTPAEQVPPPADVPVWPRVEFPVVQSTLTPVVPAPPPAVEAVPVQPGAPLPRVQSVSTPAEQIPPPADVPVWPRVEFPVVQSTLTPVVPAPPPVAVPDRPRVPIPNTESRPPSDTWHTAAQLLAWLLDHLRRIWNRDGGGDGQPGDVSAAETKRRTEDFLRLHGVSEENRDNLVGDKLRKAAGEGIGAERPPAQRRPPPGPARDPTRSR